MEEAIVSLVQQRKSVAFDDVYPLVMKIADPSHALDVTKWLAKYLATSIIHIITSYTRKLLILLLIGRESTKALEGAVMIATKWLNSAGAEVSLLNVMILVTLANIRK